MEMNCVDNSFVSFPHWYIKNMNFDVYNYDIIEVF